MIAMSPNEQLLPIGYVQLAEDIGEVMSHGRLADAQLVGNFLVLKPLADETDDLALTRSQGIDPLQFLFGELRVPWGGV